MKLLGLPLCPYCGARFFYKQVSRTKKDGEGVCPHCGGKFRIVYKRQRVLLFLAVAAVAVAANFLLLWGLDAASVIPLYVVTLLLVLLAFVLVPFVVRYRKRLPKALRADQKPAGKAGQKQKAAVKAGAARKREFPPDKRVTTP